MEEKRKKKNRKSFNEKEGEFLWQRAVCDWVADMIETEHA